MSSSSRKRYRVVFELDPTGWRVIHVPAINGCHTQAANLPEGRSRIREAMSLFIDDAHTVELIEGITRSTR